MSHMSVFLFSFPLVHRESLELFGFVVFFLINFSVHLKVQDPYPTANFLKWHHLRVFGYSKTLAFKIDSVFCSVWLVSWSKLMHLKAFFFSGYWFLHQKTLTNFYFIFILKWRQTQVILWVCATCLKSQNTAHLLVTFLIGNVFPVFLSSQF